MGSQIRPWLYYKSGQLLRLQIGAKTLKIGAGITNRGRTPVMKERLNKYAHYFEISFFERNDFVLGIPFVPEALLELREDMMLAISSLSVGCRNIVLLLSFER